MPGNLTRTNQECARDQWIGLNGCPVQLWLLSSLRRRKVALIQDNMTSEWLQFGLRSAGRLRMPLSAHGSHARFHAKEPLLVPLQERCVLPFDKKLSDHRTDPYRFSKLRSRSLLCPGARDSFAETRQLDRRHDQKIDSQSHHIRQLAKSTCSFI